MNEHPRDRSASDEARARAAGRRSSTTCGTPAEKHHLTFGPDPATHNHCTLGGMIGNNSCGVHALMAGQDASDNIDELESSPTTALRMRVGADQRRTSWSAIIREGGRRGEIYARLKRLRDRYADADPRAATRRSRAASPATTSTTLLPENGFNVARALVGTRGHLRRSCSRRSVRLVHSPPHRVAAACSAIRDIYEAADHVPEVLDVQADRAAKGIDDLLIDDMKAKGSTRATSRCSRRATGGCSSSSAARRRTRPTTKAHEADGDAEEAQRSRPSMKLYDDPRAGEAGLGGPRVGPRRDRVRPRQAATRGRVGGLGGRAGAARRLPARPPQAARQVRLRRRRSTATSARAASTRASTSIWRRAEGIAKFRSFLDEAADLVV